MQVSILTLFFVIGSLHQVCGKNFEIGLENLSCGFNSSMCSSPVCFVKLVPFKNGLLNFGCELNEATTELWVRFSDILTLNFIK